MSSETPQPPPPPSSSSPSSEPPSEPPLPTPNPITHNAALAMSILCPIALLLPTRGGRAKSTLQNALLGGAAFWGFNTLAEDYTGKSITARSGERWGAMLGFSTSSENKKDGEEKEKESKDKDKKKVGKFMSDLPTERAARNKELMEAERRRRAEAEGREYKPKDQRGWFEKWWMGGEKEGWKERRLEEERKALESGKGYGELIMDQVREVWRGEGKKGDGKEEGGKGGEEGKGKKE